MGCGSDAIIDSRTLPDGTLIQERIIGDPNCNTCNGSGWIPSHKKACNCAKRIPYVPDGVYHRGLYRTRTPYGSNEIIHVAYPQAK